MGRSRNSEAAEVQGLYGPFAFPERLLQQIWLRGEFDGSRAQTTDGQKIRVVHPGRWNSLGGPDFLGAKVRFDEGPVQVTDVEVHLHAEDWEAHQHIQDPAYNGVGLHVVLFPPRAGHVTRGAAGGLIPVLALLPLLLHDLEEYAAEAVVERMANRPATFVTEELGRLEPALLRELLVQHARARWRLRVHFARLRVQRLGWREACHHTALEILGFRYNRAPMLRSAAAWPLAVWPRAEFRPEVVFEAESGAWAVQGVRPANHPRHRLLQYAEWVRRRPNWPDVLAATGADLAAETNRGGASVNFAAEPSAKFRRATALGAKRIAWAEAIAGGAVGGTRFDTLVCDGFLPLIALQGSEGVAETYWFHWHAGDLPPMITRSLRQLGVHAGPAQPSCHGLSQGLLGWLLERERRESGI